MTLRRLAGERRGGVGVLLACALPLLLGIAAFAIDYGRLQLDARRLQGVADAAALAAAGGASDPMAAARDLTAASWSRAEVTGATRGAYAADPAIPLAARFRPGAGDAVRVEVTTRSPTFFVAEQELLQYQTRASSALNAISQAAE